MQIKVTQVLLCLLLVVSEGRLYCNNHILGYDKKQLVRKHLNFVLLFNGSEGLIEGNTTGDC